MILKTRAVILPSKSKNPVEMKFQLLSNGKLHMHSAGGEFRRLLFGGGKPHHLYYISDLSVDSTDSHGYDENENCIVVLEKEWNGEVPEGFHYKKIIGCTDPEIAGNSGVIPIEEVVIFCQLYNSNVKKREAYVRIIYDGGQLIPKVNNHREIEIARSVTPRSIEDLILKAKSFSSGPYVSVADIIMWWEGNIVERSKLPSVDRMVAEDESIHALQND